MSDDGLPLSASVTVSKKILEVILTLGNDAILVAYQINARYNTYACDNAFCNINLRPVHCNQHQLMIL